MLAAMLIHSSARTARVPLNSQPRRFPLLLRDLALTLAVCTTIGACTGSNQDPLEEIRAQQLSGQIEASIPLLIELIASGNRDGEVLYRFGRALSLTGKSGRSFWALEAAMSDPDWLVPAAYELAFNAYRSSNFELALETLDRLRNERSDSHDEDFPARLLEVRAFLNTRRDYAEALELTEAILEDEPEEQIEEEAVRLKGVALLGLKHTDEAYDLIREAARLASEVGEVGDASLASEAGEEGDDGADDRDGAEFGQGPESREAYWCMIKVSFKREAGESKEASEIVDECLERFPSSPEVMNEASQLYASLARFDRVLEILRTAHEERPEDSDLRGTLVQTLREQGQFDEAESVLRDALDEVLADDEAPPLRVASLWVDLAGYLIDLERSAEALDGFAKAIAILGDATSPDLFFRQAEAMILAKRFDEALEIANRTPVEVHGLMLRGRIAFERGDYERALAELDQAALLWPNNAPVRYYLARAAEGLGDFDRAIEEYRQAMRSDAALSAPRERLAKLHIAEGRIRHASSILRFVSPKQRSKPSTAIRLLEIEVDARLGVEPNLDIPPDPQITLKEVRRDAVRALSRGLRFRSDARAVESVLASLEERVEPSSRGDFLRERVDLLLLADAVDDAVAAARTAAAERPHDDDVRLALGRALVRNASNLGEAEQMLRSVLERRPDEVDALTSLGDLARQRNDAAVAAASYEQALEKVPDHWPALRPRIDALFALGERDRALERLETYVERDAPYDGAAALELARRLGDSASIRERRISLARQAIRFGAGDAALELLASLDPTVAAAFSPPPVDSLDSRDSAESEREAP